MTDILITIATCCYLICITVMACARLYFDHKRKMTGRNDTQQLAVVVRLCTGNDCFNMGGETGKAFANRKKKEDRPEGVIGMNTANKALLTAICTIGIVGILSWLAIWIGCTYLIWSR